MEFYPGFMLEKDKAMADDNALVVKNTNNSDFYSYRGKVVSLEEMYTNKIDQLGSF